jgi:hypothetical protein
MVMNWLIHALYADTLVLSPLVAQSVRKQLKIAGDLISPIVLNNQTLTLGVAVDSDYGPGPW